MESNRLSWPLTSFSTKKVSQGHEGLELERMPERNCASVNVVPDQFPVSNTTDENSYDRFTPCRKNVILGVLSFSSFISPMSSTMILSGIPEMAMDYSTSPSILEMSNGLYILAMGVAPVLWAPLSSIYGRRWVQIMFGSFIV